MRKRLMMVFVAIAMMMGMVGVAEAASSAKDDTKQESPHSTGEACPDSSPRGKQDPNATPPPGCGQVDRSGGQCPSGQERYRGNCVPNCPTGQTRNQQTGACETPPCPEGQERFNGNCVPKCPTGQTRDATGNCVAPPSRCGAGKGLRPDPDPTIAKSLYEGGLKDLPGIADPTAEGTVSKPVYDGFTAQAPAPVDALGREVACGVSLAGL